MKLFAIIDIYNNLIAGTIGADGYISIQDLKSVDFNKSGSLDNEDISKLNIKLQQLVYAKPNILISLQAASPVATDAKAFLKAKAPGLYESAFKVK